MRVSTLSLFVAIFNLAFHAFYAIASSLYPGGTWADRSTTGYSFWENYLCDVLIETARNGQPNPGKLYGMVAFFLLLVNFVFLYLLLDRLLTEDSSVLRKIASWAFLLTVLAFIGTVVTDPVAKPISNHVIAVLFAVAGGLVATVIPLVSLWREAKHRSFGRHGLLLVSPLMINLYVFFMCVIGIFPINNALMIVLNKISLVSISVFCFLPVFRQLQLVESRK